MNKELKQAIHESFGTFAQNQASGLRILDAYIFELCIAKFLEWTSSSEYETTCWNFLPLASCKIWSSYCF